MKTWIAILSGLLLAQLVLAIAVNLTGEEYGAFKSEEKLLVFDRQAVDGLRIEGEGQQVLIRQKDGHWLLPESEDFPADPESVTRLLDKLAALDKGWPVATTSSAANRFKVAEDQFDRKLSLLAGDQTLAELFIGTSPGFRKVHVRPAGTDEIYSVLFNTWEANAKVDDWIDKAILKLDADQVARLELPDITLERQDDQLQVNDLAEGEETNTAEVKTLLSKLTELRILASLGKAQKPEWQQEAPALEIKLAEKDGKSLGYRFSKPADETYYVLKRSDLPYYLKLADYSVQPFMDAARDELVQVSSEAAPDTEATVAEPDPDTSEAEQPTETPLSIPDQS